MRPAWPGHRWMLLGMVLAIAVSGCSGDPTQSEPYLELDARHEVLAKEVADLEAELGAVASDLEALLATADLETVDDVATELAELAAQRDDATAHLEEVAGEVADLEDESEDLADALATLGEVLRRIETMAQQLEEGEFE